MIWSLTLNVSMHIAPQRMVEEKVQVVCTLSEVHVGVPGRGTACLCWGYRVGRDGLTLALGPVVFPECCLCR